MRKTILYCITLSEMGGAQKQVYSLIRGCKQDYNIFLACAPGGELIDWVRGLDQDIRVHELPYMRRNISPVNDIKTLIDLLKLIKENKVDIVHCHSSKAGLIGRIAAWLAGVPVRIFTAHGWSINDRQKHIVKNIYMFLEKFAGYLSTHIICVSQADLNNGLDWKLAPKEKLYMIHNGVHFDPQKPYLREQLGLNDNDFIIGTVARVSEQKKPLRSIEVFKKLCKFNDKLFFVWIGSGPQLSYFQNMIAECGIQDRFIFLGNREDTERLLGDFNLFTLLSEWEGLPISIIEAMFTGLPIIATNVGGVSELVINNKNGYIVERDNKEDIIQKMEFIINNKDILQRFGKKSRLIAQQHFSEITMIKKYKKIYQQAITQLEN